MSSFNNEEYWSDGEIYIGKLPLKEIKRRLLGNHLKTYVNAESNQDDSYNSIKIIETHSEPELELGNTKISLANSDIKCDILSEPKTDSILLVKQVDNDVQCQLAETELFKSIKDNKENLANNLNFQPKETNLPSLKSEKTYDYSKELLDDKIIGLHEHLNQTSINSDKNQTFDKGFSQTKNFVTPDKEKINSNNASCLFKTPKNAASIKKKYNTPLRATPNKFVAYQHITSPVAAYIKNGPQCPLQKDIRPKKSLCGSSSIPRLIKCSENVKNNKENIILPSIAYKSAKKTKVVKAPEIEKMPENQWAKNLASSLRKPIVISHNHRENNIIQKSATPFNLEDSISGLTLHQAEISICIEESAYNKLNNKPL